jgi:phage gp37-like protein
VSSNQKKLQRQVGLQQLLRRDNSSYRLVVLVVRLYVNGRLGLQKHKLQV